MWTIDDHRARTARSITPAAQARYDAWHDDIANNGTHPRTAAENAGDMNYRELRGGHSQYEIRLSGSHRATFIVDAVLSEVRVLQIGGHT